MPCTAGKGNHEVENDDEKPEDGSTAAFENLFQRLAAVVFFHHIDKDLTDM